MCHHRFTHYMHTVNSFQILYHVNKNYPMASYLTTHQHFYMTMWPFYTLGQFMEIPFYHGTYHWKMFVLSQTDRTQWKSNESRLHLVSNLEISGFDDHEIDYQIEICCDGFKLSSYGTIIHNRGSQVLNLWEFCDV